MPIKWELKMFWNSPVAPARHGALMPPPIVPLPWSSEGDKVQNHAKVQLVYQDTVLEGTLLGIPCFI